MRNKFFAFFLLVLCGCSIRSSAITFQEYDDVQLGTPANEVIASLGEPYAVYMIGERSEEYEYVEKFSYGGELAYENHYFLMVVNGHVVSKRSAQERRPAYDQIWRVDPNYPTYP